MVSGCILTVASTEDVLIWSLQIVGLVRDAAECVGGRSIARFHNFWAQFRSFARIVVLLDH